VRVPGGYRSVALAAQTEVPWNESWYRRLGFESLEPNDWTDWMRDDVAASRSLLIGVYTSDHLRENVRLEALAECRDSLVASGFYISRNDGAQ
jgi:hypothetical protein